MSRVARCIQVGPQLNVQGIAPPVCKELAGQKELRLVVKGMGFLLRRA